jgi:3-phenylpropionate/cinnamic acid dioxygenase small subunit
MFHRTVIIHPDGTPRTQHVVSNLVVEVADDRASAAARSYVTVFQALPDAPLRPIAAGRYADRFVRRDDGWRFAARTVDIRLVGDVGRHLRVDRA